MRAAVPLDTVVLFCELLLECLLVGLLCSWLVEDGSFEVCVDFLVDLEAGFEWSLEGLMDSVVGTALWGDLKLEEGVGIFK